MYGKKGNIFIKQNTKQGSNRLDSKHNKTEIRFKVYGQSSENLPCCLLRFASWEFWGMS